MMSAETPYSDYREYLPAPALARDFVCMWTQTIGPKCEVAQPVYPDTCVDILLINETAPIVVGPWTEPFVSHLAPGTRILGARVRPGSATRLGLPAHRLLNQSAPLDAIWNRSLSSQIARIADIHDLAKRRAAMESALSHRIESADTPDPAMSEAVMWLSRHPYANIEQLATKMCLSPRQLQRRFSVAIGYGPKMFQSVLRFQRLLSLIGAVDMPYTLAELAVILGYADQAHMTREVQRFAKRSPRTLFTTAHSALQLSGLLGTPPNGCST
jgi:AraC-like DNA-binding protein